MNNTSPIARDGTPERDFAILSAAVEVLREHFTAAAPVIRELNSLRASLGAGEAAEEEPAPPAEGWGVVRPGDRKAHYYRRGMSLCRRVGLYQGRLWPDLSPSPDDHKECRYILDREKVLASRTRAARQPAGSLP